MFDENGNGGLPQMNMKINPDDLPDAECKECGNKIFVNGVRGKIVSPLLTGESAPAFVPIPTLICSKCSAEFSID